MKYRLLGGLTAGVALIVGGAPLAVHAEVRPTFDQEQIASPRLGSLFRPSDYACNVPEACLYENDRSGGGAHQNTSRDSDYYNNYWYNTTRRVEDGASSVLNKRPCLVRWYEHDNYLGKYIEGVQWAQNEDLNSTGLEDEISSFRPTC